MNLGGLDETTEERVSDKKEEKVVSIEERKTRSPFCYWTVKGREYRLKLKASTINKLENKYRKNIMTIVMADDTPPLSVMLTIIQAAMEPWEHGIDYPDIMKLYDSWTEEGGNQTDLYTTIIIPLMTVSGFFTEKQSEQILESLKDNL